MVGVPRVGADKEAFEVLVDEPTGWGATEAGGNANGAIRGLDFDEERTEDVDAPARPRLAIFFPS